MRKYVNIIAVAMQIVTLITFFVSFIVIDRDGIYGLLWLWPLTFFAYGLFVFGPFSVIKPEHLLGISLISILEFFPRYVLYPLAVSFAGNDYRGIEYASLTSTEIQNAIIMAVFELVIVGVFLFFYERGKKNKNEVYKGDLKLSGSPVVYAVFVAIAAAAYIFVGINNILFLQKKQYVQVNRILKITKHLQKSFSKCAVLKRTRRQKLSA